MTGRSALAGVIPKLERGVKLSDEAVNEIARLLAGLQAEGWSGFIPADAALSALVEARDVAQDKL